MFALSQIDLDYCQTAPYQILNEVDLPISPEATWDLLASTAWPEWFVDFVSVTWLSEPPYGVGSQRKAVLKTATAVERFVAWDRGHRLAFGLDAVSLPLVKAMMEDMRLSPGPDGGTHLSYYVFYTPNLLMKLLHPLIRAFYQRMFRQSIRNLQVYARRQVTHSA